MKQHIVQGLQTIVIMDALTKSRGINMNLEQTYPTHHVSGPNAACAQIISSRANRAMRLGGNVNDR